VSPTQHRELSGSVGASARQEAVPPAPPEVFFPFSVLPATGSHITRRVPPHPVRLRPQGFSPSRRLAPPVTCQACSILVPLMGFALRGLLPPPVPYALSSAASLLEFNRIREYSASPSGLCTPSRIPHVGLGFSQETTPVAPLGFAPSEVSCPCWRLKTKSKPTIPSHAFCGLPQADQPPGVPGFSPPRTHFFSLEKKQPPWGFLPRQLSRFFGCLATLGHGFPS